MGVAEGLYRAFGFKEGGLMVDEMNVPGSIEIDL